MTTLLTRAMIGAALLLLVGSVPGCAQSGRISGRVHVAGDTTRPVVDVELALLPGLRTTRSDSSGAFSFVSVSPGDYTLRARRVGFEVTTQEVSVDGATGSRVEMLVAMRTGAQLLAEVTISGQRVMFPARLSEPYSRVARGRGSFFTRELIDSLQPWDIKSLLQRVPGVHINDRSVRFARCDSHAVLGSDARIQIYLDGVRLTRYGSSLSLDANAVLRDVVISAVQLVEVYPSISSVPPEYGDDACAVILIWSR